MRKEHSRNWAPRIPCAPSHPPAGPPPLPAAEGRSRFAETPGATALCGAVGIPAVMGVDARGGSSTLGGDGGGGAAAAAVGGGGMGRRGK